MKALYYPNQYTFLGKRSVLSLTLQPYCFSFATPRYCDAFFRNFILRYVHMNIDEGLQRERHCFCAFVTEINRSHRVNHLANSQNAQNCPPLRVCGCTPTEPNLTKITPPCSFLKTLSFYRFVTLFFLRPRRSRKAVSHLALGIPKSTNVDSEPPFCFFLPDF
jgi:hypothetical protein